MTWFEKLADYLQMRYYGDLFMGVFEFSAIIIGLLFVRQYKVGVYFLIYLIFDFSVLVCYDYLRISQVWTSGEVSNFRDITNVFISLIELLVYSVFFLSVIHNNTIVKLVKIFRIVFIATILFFTILQLIFGIGRLSYASDLISVLEFSFLLTPSLVYFYELLRMDPVINLYQRPSFWIATGIFFYSVISIPYYLIAMFVLDNTPQYSRPLNFVFFVIPFTINFLFLARAFLLKKPLGT